MKCLNNTIKILGLGMIAAVVATGCAAKKGPTSSQAAAADSSYTVAKGDCLWCIAGQSKIYGNPYLWPLLYKANSGSIKDADLIYADQVLTVDRAASDGEKGRADKHSRNRGPWQIGVVEESDKAYLAGG